MIQELHIRNYQSHKDTTLEFHPGVNIILGITDSGKTSILRSIKKLVWNRPSGNEFCSHWGGDMEIEMITDDHTIARGIDKENWYSLDGKRLVAFGKDVPEEIRNALNMDETNLQQQFDLHFLISSSPGEVASHFNQVAHLHQIDSSISFVNRNILALTNTKKADEGSLKNSQEELTQYDYLDKFEIELEVLEHDTANNIQIITSRNKLQTQLDLLEEKEKEIEKIEVKTKLEKPVNAILKLYTDQKIIEDDRAYLLAALIYAAEIDKATIILSKKVGQLALVDSILKLMEEKKTLQRDHDTLRDALSENRIIIDKQTKTKERLEKKEAKFHKHMPDECPLCGFDSRGLN